MERPWYTIALAVASGAWAILSAITLLCSLRSLYSRAAKRFRLSGAQQPQSLRERLARIGMGCDVKDKSMLAKVVEQAQVERVCRARKTFTWLTLGWSCIIMQRELRATFILLSATGGECVITVTTMWMLWCFQLPVAAMAFRPQLITRRSLRVVYTLIVAFDVFELGLTSEIETAQCSYHVPQEVRTIRAYVPQLLFALIIQDSAFTLLLKLGTLPVSVLMIFLHRDHYYEERWIMEMAFTSFLCVSSVAMERATTAGIHASLEAQSSRAFGSAADALLSSMCDAVVHLSQAFDCTKDCPRLSTMLLRDPAVPLRTNFCDLLMTESDKEAFRQFMQAQELAGDVLAHTTHVTLRDAYHTPVLVQLFHTTCIDTITDEEVHIVGLRDVGGERQAPMPPDSVGPIASPAAVHPTRGLSEERPGALEPISEYSMPDTISNSEALSVFQVDTSTGADAIKVWINTLEADLPLLGWTPGFANIVGLQSLHSGANLTDLLPSRKEKRRIGRELQHITNSLMHDDGEIETTAGEMGSRMKRLWLTMNTKHWGNLNISSRVDLDWGFQGEDGDAVATVLEFQAWCQTKGRRRSQTVKEALMLPEEPVDIIIATAKSAAEASTAAALLTSKSCKTSL